ncbi:MAG: acyl-CoA ligase (AMP-forming), exosortase A system-associated, partial [Gammaproteobacteria bacterium]
MIAEHARRSPGATALLFKGNSVSYSELFRTVDNTASGLLALGVKAGERVATYLPKQPENVYGIFGTASAGASFVPVNPLLKPKQVAYILADCNVCVLITSGQRLKLLQSILGDCPNLHTVVIVEDSLPTLEEAPKQTLISWPDFLRSTPTNTQTTPHSRIDTDMAAILYTSGSTGSPKGVVLSHRNMVAGANSVASYLENTAQDRLLAVLPLSFDAGLSQLTTAFSVGASVVL